MAIRNFPPREVPPHDGLCDELGPIPVFPPLQCDEHGRLIPLTPEEQKARSEAAIRALAAIAKLPDDDPPGIEAEFMRGIDENRGPGREIFKDLGIY
jgi:hypothetical protein